MGRRGYGLENVVYIPAATTKRTIINCSKVLYLV
jgi:hypothetical protein